MAKKKKPVEEIKRPDRAPDHMSKRGVPYWFSPEWIRANDGSEKSFGKIACVKDGHGGVDLYMKSKAGNYTYIQGSIQREFRAWHEDREIDCILLGLNIEDLVEGIEE